MKIFVLAELESWPFLLFLKMAMYEEVLAPRNILTRVSIKCSGEGGGPDTYPQ